MRDDSPPSSDDVKAGFAPIKLHNSVELHLHADPDIQRADLVKQLEYAAAGVDKGGPSGLQRSTLPGCFVRHQDSTGDRGERA